LVITLPAFPYQGPGAWGTGSSGGTCGREDKCVSKLMIDFILIHF
jgi:hypothetical protein